MKIRSIVLAIGTAALAALSPSVVGAEPLTPVVINAHPCTFGPPLEIGTWEASGAINDSGTYVRTENASSPPNRAFGVSGPGREAFTFTSSNGSFDVKAEEKLTATGVTGVWQLSSGTGSYGSASGHGDGISFSFDPNQTNSCPSGFKNFTYQLMGIASTA
jgi:hypothetical protein